MEIDMDEIRMVESGGNSDHQDTSEDEKEELMSIASDDADSNGFSQHGQPWEEEDGFELVEGVAEEVPPVRVPLAEIPIRGEMEAVGTLLETRNLPVFNDGAGGMFNIPPHENRQEDTLLSRKIFNVSGDINIVTGLNPYKDFRPEARISTEGQMIVVIDDCVGVSLAIHRILRTAQPEFVFPYQAGSVEVRHMGRRNLKIRRNRNYILLNEKDILPTSKVLNYAYQMVVQLQAIAPHVQISYMKHIQECAISEIFSGRICTLDQQLIKVNVIGEISLVL